MLLPLSTFYLILTSHTSVHLRIKLLYINLVEKFSSSPPIRECAGMGGGRKNCCILKGEFEGIGHGEAAHQAQQQPLPYGLLRSRSPP